MPPEPREVPTGLHLVATPIGNLRDITLRALDVLAGVEEIFAEDTRVTAKLLAAYGIKTRLGRYDEHSAAKARPRILERLAEGARLAVVSDAGTPLISDPGYRLVVEAVAAGVPVWPLPGPSAVLAALAVAGLPTDRFLFAGFAPPRSSARRRFLKDLAAVRSTLVLFETGPRLAESLADMAAVFGPRPAAVARELTKLHETVVRGSLDKLAENPALAAPKGEIVVVIGPPLETAADPAAAEAALLEALQRLKPAAAAAEVAHLFGVPRRALYARALVLRGQ
jgi:16S rRNA (cytidine1402-2'-O)-methyltransferase